jgi:hypothetical protein
MAFQQTHFAPEIAGQEDSALARAIEYGCLELTTSLLEQTIWCPLLTARKELCLGVERAIDAGHTHIIHHLLTTGHLSPEVACVELGVLYNCRGIVDLVIASGVKVTSVHLVCALSIWNVLLPSIPEGDLRPTSAMVSHLIRILQTWTNIAVNAALMVSLGRLLLLIRTAGIVVLLRMQQ